MTAKSLSFVPALADEPRVAVVAVVETPYGDITIANTHLSFIGWWNRHQLRP